VSLVHIKHSMKPLYVCPINGPLLNSVVINFYCQCYNWNSNNQPVPNW